MRRPASWWGRRATPRCAVAGAMIAQVLERLGLPVERRLGLGPTLIVRTSLLSGEITVYPEYTGNGAFFTATETDPAWKSPQSAYETIRRADAAKGLVWLNRAPANNTWLIAVNGGLARRDGLKTMHDFAGAVRDDHIRLAASTSSWRALRPCRPSRRPTGSTCPTTGSSACRGATRPSPRERRRRGSAGSMPGWSMARTVPSRPSISR